MIDTFVYFFGSFVGVFATVVAVRVVCGKWFWDIVVVRDVDLKEAK